MRRGGQDVGTGAAAAREPVPGDRSRRASSLSQEAQDGDAIQTTATLTEIGTGDYPTGIALAATPDGTLYTYDINADVLVQLDKTTGAGTVIGPIGFDANFGQGMTYDYVNDVMYMAAYNNGVGQPELRAVDLETGATTLVGPLGVAQMGWAGAPATGANFLVVTPESGTVEAGGSVDISVVADATELNGGTYEAALVITTNDPENPELVVDVTVNVTGAPGITIEPGSIDFGDVIDGNEATQEVEITNSGTDVLNVSDITVEGDAFSVDFDDAFSLEVGESETVLVTFTPDGAGDYSGTLTVESDAPSSPDEVALTGTGLDQPTPEVDPTELTFEVQVGTTTSESFTLTNVGGDDAADLEYEISVAEARPAPTATTPAANARTANTTAANARTLSNLNKAANALRHATTAGRFGTEFTAVDGSTGSPLDSPIEVTGPPRALYRGGEVIITHSQSQEIIPLSGIACPTPPNSWFRVFDLSEFISGNLEVTSVDIGMEEVGPGGATVVNLYTLDGPLLNENLTLVSSAELVVSPADNLSIVNVPISGEFSADDVMVLEWAVPFAGVYFGGNELGQTGPTYIQAAACGATEPADLATLGDFPLNAWVANVHGNAGSSLVSVSPESGTIAPGDSDEITVTVDATELEVGTYDFELLIATNDPENATVTVPVTVEVVPVVANEGDGVPTEFALSQNYPNPFAGATTIEYALPEAAHVTITVYDAVGRRIAVLVNEDLTTGYHKAEWDTRGLAAGVYLYRIEAGDYVRTKKMSLVR